MRSALVTLLCAFGLVVSGGTGTRAGGKADVEKELKKFQGVWTVESLESGGKKIPADTFKGMTLTYDGDKYTVKNGKEVIQVGTQKVDLPVAVSIFPGELFRPLKVWGERIYPQLFYWNEGPKGGHFAAFEQPNIFVTELRKRFARVR